MLVSAVEGQFEVDRKIARHPHTNMAKAALNMIVRTCAARFAARRIYLTSVDTGWISHQWDYFQTRRMKENGSRLPLDAEDGAARILDPIFTSVNTGVNLYGVFLKNYHPAPW